MKKRGQTAPNIRSFQRPYKDPIKIQVQRSEENCTILAASPLPGDGCQATTTTNTHTHGRNSHIPVRHGLDRLEWGGGGVSCARGTREPACNMPLLRGCKGGSQKKCNLSHSSGKHTSHGWEIAAKEVSTSSSGSQSHQPQNLVFRGTALSEQGHPIPNY